MKIRIQEPGPASPFDFGGNPRPYLLINRISLTSASPRGAAAYVSRVEYMEIPALLDVYGHMKQTVCQYTLKSIKTHTLSKSGHWTWISPDASKRGRFYRLITA